MEYMGMVKYPASVLAHHNDGYVSVSHGGIEMGQGLNTKVKLIVYISIFYMYITYNICRYILIYIYLYIFVFYVYMYIYCYYIYNIYNDILYLHDII